MIEKRDLVFVFLVAAIAAVGAVHAQSVRDHILVVGSSTVYPLATAVIEQFSKTTRFKPPEIQSTGTGAGLKLFCAGSGIETPDIANASRRIKSSEVETCAKNGVKEIVEVKFGYDTVVVAQAAKGKLRNLTRKQLFLALAKDVPDPRGGTRLVVNPYKTSAIPTLMHWHQ